MPTRLISPASMSSHLLEFRLSQHAPNLEPVRCSFASGFMSNRHDPFTSESPTACRGPHVMPWAARSRIPAMPCKQQQVLLIEQRLCRPRPSRRFGRRQGSTAESSGDTAGRAATRSSPIHRRISGIADCQSTGFLRECAVRLHPRRLDCCSSGARRNLSTERNSAYAEADS